MDPFTRAVTLHGAGQPLQALALYDELLKAQPTNVKLAELAGIACMQLNRYGEAAVHFQQACKGDQTNHLIYNNLGVSLNKIDELKLATEALRQAVRLQPGYVEAQTNLGLVLEQQGLLREAAETFLASVDGSGPTNERALAGLLRLVRRPEIAARMQIVLAAKNIDGHEGLQALREMAFAQTGVEPSKDTLALLHEAARKLTTRDFSGAARDYEAFLQIAPHNAAAWNNLGVARRSTGNGARAIAALRRATDLDPQFALAWSNLGAALIDVRELQEARSALDRALLLTPGLAQAHSNLGMLHRLRHESIDAAHCYERAIELDRTLFEAHLNLGNLRYEYGDEEGAHAAFRQAADLKPDDADAAYSIGVTERDPATAVAQLERALSLRARHPEAEMARAFMQLKACDWTDLDARIRRIEEMTLDPAGPALAPFWLLAMTDSRQAQLECARKWARAKLPALAAGRSAPVEAAKPSAVVRVGLLSGDLRDHAVGHLLRDVLPRIDAGRCELWAYDASPDDGSATRAALLSACHRVRPVAMMSGDQLAGQIRADGIDVLVDLSGYSQHSRSQVLAQRPAPVQVSYLGFPGTMGWNAVDYLLADDYLVPVQHESDYAERIVRMPGCYQPARHFDCATSSRPTRASQGLPERALVLASFGNAYKLRPAIFHCWLRVLAAHPGSVLWLARFNSAMESNLRQCAKRAGIDPGRLIFAPMVDLDTHMARLPLADLCLDTAPYGSGVTATQALYTGVPLLTLAGSTYVGRMAASLLHTLALPTLIAADLQDYEERALALAGDGGVRRELRETLLAAHQSNAAFDVARSAFALEQTFMDLAQAGSPSNLSLS